MLQQIPRNRLRCQDVLDIALILAQRQLDEASIAAFLVQKASVRNVQVCKRAFRDDEIRSRASENYADLQATVRKAFIPFEADVHL